MTEAGDMQPGGPSRTELPLPSVGRAEQWSEVLKHHRGQAWCHRGCGEQQSFRGAVLHRVTKALLKLPKVTASVPWV